MGQGKISVIIPVYNVAAQLPRCVDSILTQTYENLEVLLVDDGSTDGSGNICDRCALQDSRVRTVHRENGGASAARNTGLGLATGEYLAFVDGDDYIEPQMYQTLLDALRWTDRPAAVCGFYSGNKVHLVKRNGWRECWLALLRGELWMASLCNKLYRRDCWGELRLPEEIRFTEDLLANARYFAGDQSVAVVPQGLYHYEDRRDSTMRTALSLGHFDALEVSKELAAFAKSEAERQCADRQRTLIELSLINRILRSGTFGERYDPLRQSILERKRAILQNPYNTSREHWMVRLLECCPVLYRWIVTRRRLP